MINNQVSFRVTPMTPAHETVTHEMQQFFRDEQTWGTDRNLRQIYIRNFPRIRDSETINRRSRI